MYHTFSDSFSAAVEWIAENLPTATFLHHRTIVVGSKYAKPQHDQTVVHLPRGGVARCRTAGFRPVRVHEVLPTDADAAEEQATSPPEPVKEPDSSAGSSEPSDASSGGFADWTVQSEARKKLTAELERDAEEAAAILRNMRDACSWEKYKFVGGVIRNLRAVYTGDKEFMAALEERGLGREQLDFGDRCRLMKCMDHLDEIEKWRNALPANKRAKLNHPSSIWRAWKKDNHEEEAELREADDDAEPGDTEQSSADTDEEQPRKKPTIAELQAQLAERDATLAERNETIHGISKLNGKLLHENQKLRSEGGLWDGKMNKDEIAAALLEEFAAKLTPEKAAAVIAVLNESRRRWAAKARKKAKTGEDAETADAAVLRQPLALPSPEMIAKAVGMLT